jgi:hypothetical protein
MSLPKLLKHQQRTVIPGINWNKDSSRKILIATAYVTHAERIDQPTNGEAKTTCNQPDVETVNNSQPAVSGVWQLHLNENEYLGRTLLRMYLHSSQHCFLKSCDENVPWIRGKLLSLVCFCMPACIKIACMSPFT